MVCLAQSCQLFLELPPGAAVHVEHAGHIRAEDAVVVYNVVRNGMGVDVVAELAWEDGEPVHAGFGDFGGGCSVLVVETVGGRRCSVLIVVVAGIDDAGCSVLVVKNPENHGAGGFFNATTVGVWFIPRRHLAECRAGSLQNAVDYAS